MLASRVVLQTETVIYKGLYGMYTVFLKRENECYILKYNRLPYCLVEFFVVCQRLSRFEAYFGELVLLWCSTAKGKR